MRINQIIQLFFGAICIACGANAQVGSAEVAERLAHKGVNQEQDSKGFLENKGQMQDMNGHPHSEILFKSEEPGLNIWITETGITYQTFHTSREDTGDLEMEEIFHTESRKINQWERIDLKLYGAQISKDHIRSEYPETATCNYFLPVCPKGIYGVSTYRKITISDVYPGIDWVLYRNDDGSFKYDFVVHPNGDYRQIKLVCSSLQPTFINDQHELIMRTDYGEVKEEAPVSYYQESLVETRFEIVSQQVLCQGDTRYYETTIGFDLQIAEGSRTTPLIIDPEMVWASYYGGNQIDGIVSVETDSWGHIYMSGYTGSLDFPVVDAGGGSYFQGSTQDNAQAFIVRMDANSIIEWATFYGGTDNDTGSTIAFDSFNNVYMIGSTYSPDFPSEDMGGGAYFESAPAGSLDVFVVKFNDAGVRLWATCFGGELDDTGTVGIVDESNNYWITGYTTSLDLPTMALNSNTYLQTNFGGGSHDSFIAKFDATGVLIWSTYFGGQGTDTGFSLAMGISGDLVAIGITGSNDLPTEDPGGMEYFQSNLAPGVNNEFDLYFTRFDAEGALIWSTYFGGDAHDLGYSIQRDQSGCFFVSGNTSSTTFPVQSYYPDSYFQSNNAGLYDAFILKMDPNGVLLWSTYYGGSLEDQTNAYPFDNISIDDCGYITMAISSGSNDIQTMSGDSDDYLVSIPVTPGDALLAKFCNSGVMQWASFIACPGGGFRCTIDHNLQGDLLLSYELNGSAEFSVSYPLIDPGGGVYFDTTQNGGFDDSFLVKFEMDQIFPSFDTLTTPATCLNAGSIEIELAGICPPANFICSNGDSILNANEVSQMFTDLLPGVYSILVQGYCDTLEIPFEIYLECNEAIAIYEMSDTEICAGDSIEFVDISISPGAIDTWQWSFEGGIPATENGTGPHMVVFPEAGIFPVSLEVTDGTLQDDTLVLITVHPYPEISFADELVLCDETSVINLDITTDNASYLWYDGSQESTHEITEAGNYWAQVTVNGCSTFDTIQIVSSLLQPIELGPDIILCDGDSTIIGVQPISDFTYLWNTQQTTSTIVATQEGVYAMQCSLGDCSVLDMLEVSVIERSFDSSSVSFCNSPNYDIRIPFEGAQFYLWDDGTEGRTRAVAESGEYTYSVIDSVGCLHEGRISVSLTDVAPIYIPNAFTPDGDRINDVFVPVVSGLDFYHLRIYNRWGELVFETENQLDVWMGNSTRSGEYYAPDGVYIYQLEYSTPCGIEILNVTGTITMIR